MLTFSFHLNFKILAGSGEVYREDFRTLSAKPLHQLPLEVEAHDDSKDGYIFDLPTDTCYRQHWKLFCEVNGITCTTPYELRHTFVSVVKRLPVGEVKKLVGHSENMDIFDIYGHELEGEDIQTAETINGSFQKLIDSKKSDPE